MAGLVKKTSDLLLPHSITVYSASGAAQSQSRRRWPPTVVCPVDDALSFSQARSDFSRGKTCWHPPGTGGDATVAQQRPSMLLRLLLLVVFSLPAPAQWLLTGGDNRGADSHTMSSHASRCLLFPHFSFRTLVMPARR